MTGIARRSSFVKRQKTTLYELHNKKTILIMNTII